MAAAEEEEEEEEETVARGGRGQRERSGGNSLAQTRRTHGTRFHRWLVGYGWFVRTIETSPAEGEPRASERRRGSGPRLADTEWNRDRLKRDDDDDDEND